jgi:hypothetical protein
MAETSERSGICGMAKNSAAIGFAVSSSKVLEEIGGNPCARSELSTVIQAKAELRLAGSILKRRDPRVN